MYIASIYIKDHYLFEGPQTINFGGRFLYDFSNILGITRTDNPRFIETLYAPDNLELISAIVGKNGTGKTTLLRNIISYLNGQEYGVDYILFIEDGNTTYSMSSSMSFGCEFTERRNKLDFSTIYYSPYLDFKEPLRGIDLSYDAILEEDFEASSDKFVGSNEVNPKRWLKSQNTLRILEFQLSAYANELKNHFEFPNFERARISFIRHKIDINTTIDEIEFDNTPRELRYSLQPLYNKIRKESKEINENRPKGYSLVNLQKSLFKNYIIMDVICLFISQMEKKNQYLEEGFLEVSTSEFLNLIKNLDSKNAFYKFLDLHYYKIGREKSKILPIVETKNMINYLFDVIDSLETKNESDTRNFDWGKKSIYLDISQTRKLLEYHTTFLNEVDKYYGGLKGKDGLVLFKKSDRIEGLINYEPSERDLSSGETALLNFYSRIFYYFKKQINDVLSINNKKYYFIFLDEADMGYHPKWKKSFIKSIVSFLPAFFQNLGAQIQIIFTTHDPLTLSDIPKDSVIYLSKNNNESYILNSEDKASKRTFGANVHDLLADSFFLEDGFIGDFAKDRIHFIIDWLNNEERNLEEINVVKKLINIIDEPITKNKLAEMFDSKLNEHLRVTLIRDQIKELQKLENSLTK